MLIRNKSLTFYLIPLLFCALLHLADFQACTVDDETGCSEIFQVTVDNTHQGQSVCNFAENCTSCCSYGQVCCGLNPCCNGTCCNGECCDINVGTCQTLASGTDTCVPYGYVVCTNDICGAACEVHGQIPPTCQGFTCCNNSNTICCPDDHYCCGDICCPAGSQYCGGNSYCDAGSTCCGDGCCPDTNICCINTCIAGNAPCCGTYYCDPDYFCCGDTCCPPGSDYCGDNRYCSSGSHCCGSGCCDSDKDCGAFDWCWFGAVPHPTTFAEENDIPAIPSSFHDFASCKSENGQQLAGIPKKMQDQKVKVNRMVVKNNVASKRAMSKKSAYKFKSIQNTKWSKTINDNPVLSDRFKCVHLKDVSSDPCEGFPCFITVTDCSDSTGYLQYFGNGILCEENNNAINLLDDAGLTWWNCSRQCVTSAVQINVAGNQVPCCNAIDQYGLDTTNVDCMFNQCNFCSVGNENYIALETIFQGNHQNPYWQQILDFYNNCASAVIHH